MHAEPGGASFVGGGLWHPDSGTLQRLRASIDERPRRWRRVLNDPRFRQVFLDLPPSASSSSSAGVVEGRGRKGGKKKKAAEAKDDDGNGEEAALKAFAEANREGALKTRPKGFVPEHRDMQLLKLKSFTVGKKLDDGVFASPEGQDEVAGIVAAMAGFVSIPALRG